MPVTPKQIETIRARSEDWRKAWWELYAELADVLERRLPDIGIGWADAAQPELFAARMLDLYARRAEDGTLLVGFNGSDGTDAIAYLAAGNFLHNRALDFLSQEVVARPFREDEDPGAAGPSDRERRTQCAHDALREIVLELSPETPVTRAVEQAGMQLEPRLDWEHENHTSIKAHLPVSIVGVESWDGCREALAHHHDAAGADLDARIVAKRDELRKTRSKSKNRLTLTRQLQELAVKRALEPLGAERVRALLGLANRNLADRRLSDYRKARLALLRRVWRAFSAHSGDDDDVGCDEGG